MRDYMNINNYSGIGQIGISRNAIAAIASAALREVGGASVFGHKPRAKEGYSIPSGVHVVLTKDGRASIQMEVTLSRGVPSVPVACQKIQETVATAVTLMCDTVPFDVQVKVMRIV